MNRRPVKIILLEDNPLDARLFRLFLGESQSTLYRVTHVETLQAGLAQLRQEEYDLILSDLSLPDSHDLDTFRQLHHQAPDIPSIVLSGSDDENLAVQAVREGAQDYLVKGRVDAHGLMRAISYAMERHRAEHALQESERHYKRLLESITDYVYTVELEQGQPVRSVHGPGCITITGFGPDELAATSDLWQMMVPEEDRPVVVARVQEVVAGKSPSPLEHRLIHKSGQLRWVRHTFVPGRNEEGVLVSYDGLISDITERKQAEEKLVKSEAFYHSLVENLPQNIFRKDREERFTFANQRFCNLLGKPLEEIIGKTDFDFYPPELAGKFQRDDRWVIETGRIFETVEENKSASGEKIHVQVVKTPIYDPNGQILGTQCIFWDITERKQFEERLQNANAELARNEQALRQSNEALRAAQMQLIQAEKMESIGTLAAGVAHEVKNPLAILMMGLNYLTKKLQGDDHIAAVMKEMQEAIQRADSITRELLDFASNRQLAIQPEQLNELVQETLRLLRHALKEKQIDLREEYAPDLPRVGADKRQIQQVFVNLFMNAIHAIPSEGGIITIRTCCKELTEATHFEGSRRADRMWVGDTVVVAEVEDTGTGIPEEYLVKIFDPFFTTKPTGLGTGLGLSVSRKIIELHGGTLSIKNIEGSGVRVTVTLKACKR